MVQTNGRHFFLTPWDLRKLKVALIWDYDASLGVSYFEAYKFSREEALFAGKECGELKEGCSHT